VSGDGLRSDTTHVVDLTDVERGVLRQHFQWGGPAHCSDATAAVIGYATADDLHGDLPRLHKLVRDHEPMTCLDWRRLLVSGEILFGSDVLGCGLEWGTVTGFRDAETIAALRSLPRKLARIVRWNP
jgi:hypothetical protein